MLYDLTPWTINAYYGFDSQVKTVYNIVIHFYGHSYVCMSFSVVLW